MNERPYFFKLKKILDKVQLQAEEHRSWEETLYFLLPPLKKWPLPIIDLAIHHETEDIKQGIAEIWVYMYAAFFDYKNISAVELATLLLRAAMLQIGFTSRKYEYDKEYACQDGSIVFLKRIPLKDLEQELKHILELIKMPSF